MHCFHPLISEEHWGLLLILDIGVGITFTRNKHDILVINITKSEEPNNAIPHQINDTLKERQKTFPKIVEALAKITHLIGKQGTAYRGTEEQADGNNASVNPGNFLAIVLEIITILYFMRTSLHH